MEYSIFDIQTQLQRLAFNVGPIDGVFGPQTKIALMKFKVSVGLPNTPIIGPLTIAALFDRKEPTIAAITSNEKNEPIWLQVAKNYIGVEEVVGPRHNPIILGWWKRLGLPFHDDETPWCAGFVGGCLEECGIKSTKSGLALSYANWGVRLAGPALGAIVTFTRQGGGHVGFVVGVSKTGKLIVLGGNQSNGVNLKMFDCNRVVAYTWPIGTNRPIEIGTNYLPKYNSLIDISTKEA